MYKYLDDIWKKYYRERPDEYKAKIIGWRREAAIQRADMPSRLDRARRLGYKAKAGFVVIRVRVAKGGIKLERPTSGRRPKHLGTKKIAGNKNSKLIAIDRVRKKYRNLTPIGAYYLGEDGRHKWYEIILKDDQLLNPSSREGP